MSELRRRPLTGTLDCTGLHPVLGRVYAARGVTDEGQLDLSLDRLLPVSTLAGVEAAARLLAAHRDGRIIVIGDFDADGATSSALVVRALRSMGYPHVDYLVPDRFRLGYGLTPQIVGLAAARRPTLIITVDNGVSSVEGVEAARAAGISVLVTDHHLPGSVLPPADVIVNPNLPGSTFGSCALAGVGVAFYVMTALARELNAPGYRAAELLDLVALGTVADVVTLDHNNRVLVEQGLRRIRAGRCVPGIRALLESAGRRLERVTAADLGFAAGPRLNAAGRLSDMSVGIECLLTDDPRAAERLAAQLSGLNEERREIEQRMQAEAVEIASGMHNELTGAMGLCLFDEGWHQGVVGLVAGRIKDRLHRPVVAFARTDDGSLRGSARSVPGVHIRDALDAIAVRHPGLIVKFGGHAMAAGMSLEERDLERFRSAFAAEIAGRADPAALCGVVHSDGELRAAELSVETAGVLRAAGPWGQGFPEPVFDGEFTVAAARILAGKHLKLQLNGAPGAYSCARGIEAIAFGYVGSVNEHPGLTAGSNLEIAYRLEVNEFRGTESVQLNCQHLRLT